MRERKITDDEIEEPKECCHARSVLWYLIFLGFAINYPLRTNLNLAIVAMVQPKDKDNVSITSECLRDKYPTLVGLNDTPFNEEHQIIGSTPRNHEFDRSFDLLEYNYSNANINTQEEVVKEQKFVWDEKLQSNVLGSYFWLHWTTNLAGGVLANKYGSKIVFGLSNFGGVVCCFAIPYFAKMGATYLIILRLIQGFICGFTWPSTLSMAGRWIPPNERSRFATAYLGSSIGGAFFYPLFGFIIDQWGWEYVFYVCGVFGTVWFIAWCLLAYDSPAEHPRISEQEKQYILKSLGETVAEKKAPTPWRDIFRDSTVWMTVFAEWGGLWGHFTLTIYSPTYFKFIHGWNIQATGFLSGMPHLSRVVWGYVFSLFGDYLLRSNKMSRTNVRKFATFISCIVQGILMLILAYSGCNSIMAIVFLNTAAAAQGSSSTGPLAGVVDLSPNYAAILMGIQNTAASISGFCIPAVVGHLTFQNQTTPQWQKVFWLASSVLFSSGILYILFAKLHLRPWNSPENRKKLPEEELEEVKASRGSREDIN